MIITQITKGSNNAKNKLYKYKYKYKWKEYQCSDVFYLGYNVDRALAIRY